jgi:hypothetical protein
MAYLDGQILDELRKLNQGPADHTPVLLDMLAELRLLRVSVYDNLEMGTGTSDSVNILVPDAPSL